MPGFHNAVIYARYSYIYLDQNITRLQFHPGEYPHKIRPGKRGGGGGHLDIPLPFALEFRIRPELISSISRMPFSFSIHPTSAPNANFGESHFPSSNVSRIPHCVVVRSRIPVVP